MKEYCIGCNYTILLESEVESIIQLNIIYSKTKSFY